MPDRGYPLEPDAAQRRELSERVVAFAESFVADRSTSPASSDALAPPTLAALQAPPPEDGTDLAPLLDLLSDVVDTGFDTASGTHMSYIPGGAIYSAALAGFLGAVTNRYTGGNHASPGAIALEQSVNRWLCSLFDLPETAAAILLSGGSIANLTAAVTARSRFGDDFRDGVVYTSERAHHSVEKAARIAGIAGDRIRTVPADRALRLDADALRDAIALDQAAGLRPMMIVATAGTTDTGAIDPLVECAAIASASGAWLHVDAAYGGFFVLTERGRRRLAGIELADSITLDAHKSLFLPFGVGGLVVRDRRSLIEAHEGRGAYMQDLVDSADFPQFFALGPELTRPFRGLSVWLPLHLHGVGRFRIELDRMLDLAEHAATVIGAIDGVELAAATDLSVVSFRSVHGDDDTRRIFDAVNAARAVHLSSTTVDDTFTIRIALLSQRTTTEKLETLLRHIRQLARPR